MARQIVLDTETTGLDFKTGHRIIEIGCVEMVNRRLTGNNLHLYLQPDREIDPGAMEVHGITNEFLIDKPRFANISEELESYLVGAELIIHNADFDIGFLDNEFELMNHNLRLRDVCEVTDSLAMARKLYPGQRNNLDALCRRLGVNNSHRTLHGALLDSEILADVYLVMTGGQTDLGLDEASGMNVEQNLAPLSIDAAELLVVSANPDELEAHEQWLSHLDKESGGACVWNKLSGVT